MKKQSKKIIKISKKISGEKITGDMAIAEVIKKYPKTFEVFVRYNLPCVGCASAHFENLKAIADEFGIDLDKFVEDLNKATK